MTKKRKNSSYIIHPQDIFLALSAILFTIACIPLITYVYFAKDIVNRDILLKHNDIGVTLFDDTQKPFFTFFQAEPKINVAFNNIPTSLQHAVIAIEDKDFYTHSGFSVQGIIRSFIFNIQEKKLAYGGSTITQQLVKNVLLTPRKDIIRKIQEIVLAQEIERKYTKRDILEMYLNSAYFGEGAFGIHEAAKTYFGKDVSRLTLAESALLAGLLPAPSQYSPFSGNEKKTKQRQQLVLKKMYENGYISLEEKQQAEKEAISFNPQPTTNTYAPHFALLIKEQLIKDFGEETIARSGFRVYTTLHSDWQKKAEEIVKKQVTTLAPNRVTNGSTVVIDPKTGYVKALVGSTDWYNTTFGKVNIATSLRQPGSSFKPIVYLAALEDKLITPATILHDQPTTFGKDYRPQNYDRSFRGNVTVRRALANSLNVPAVEVITKLGVENAIDMAKKLGITTLEDATQYGYSLPLGTAEVKLLELTSAYGTFANEGIKNKPVFITKIVDKRNNVVYSHTPTPEHVIDPEYTFLISSILSDANARLEVFGNLLTISRPAAVKTGTSENYKDSVTVGYTPSLVIGAWVGNNDGTPMDNVAGSLGAAPIWKQLMEAFLRNTPIEQFKPPTGITTLSICGQNGFIIKTATSTAQTEYFVKGTEPTQYCTFTTPTPIASPSAQIFAPKPSQNTSIEHRRQVIFTEEENQQKKQNVNKRGRKN